MRPYRAIPIDGKDFVYGWYVKCRGEHYILPLHNPDDPESSFDERWIQMGTDKDGWFKVIPETVGQQVGLKDKNGTEIWENDVMLSKDGLRKYKVAYQRGHYYLDGLGKAWNDNEPKWYELEIIGNIHQEQDNDSKNTR